MERLDESWTVWIRVAYGAAFELEKRSFNILYILYMYISQIPIKIFQKCRVCPGIPGHKRRSVHAPTLMSYLEVLRNQFRINPHVLR